MNKNELEREIKKTIDMFPGLYNKYEYNYLKNIDLDKVKKEYTIDILRQILEYYNYYNEEDSIYEYFINNLNKENKLNRNIVEVGGGIIPTLGKKISMSQKYGTITIYDPKLSNFFKENDKFILKKDIFTPNIDISNSDLLIGFMPCEATEDIITSAGKYKKDFIIQMCEGGAHGDEFDYYEDSEEWMSSMIYYAKKIVKDNNLGKLKVLKLPDKYGIKYPIIENIR